MGMRVKHRPGWYALRAGMASVLALGTAGLVAASSAAASPAASGGPHCNASVTRNNFGTANSGPYGGNQTVWRYIITNGATVQSIRVPDRHGHIKNVALGFRTLKDYVNLDSPPPTSPNFGGPYFGETIGRYANRIGGASFNLNGTTYTLPVNNGPNTLHGGFVGWGNRIWQHPTVVAGHGRISLTMSLVAPNGDEGSGLLPGTNNFEPNCSIPSAPATTCTGFPAQVTTHITYSLDNANRLWIRYRAHNDDAHLSTVINLTNHTYFNLAGEASGPAYAQRVLINANRFTPTDANLIPTGAEVPVAGTPFAGLRFAAAATDPRSGRALVVWTNEPGVQFYTGNFLDGHLVGISGHTYRQSAGYTFETQHFPNSPNQPNFPSTVLRAGKTFNSTTIYQFGAR